jgi:5-(carboxyamino)imidazole ribonucleotide synthase
MKIGILGSGQLGRMLAIAGAQLDLEVSLLDNSKAESPSDIFSRFVKGDLQDEKTVKEFAHSKDVVTSEFENISAQTLGYANAVTSVLPSPEVFKTASDRLLEKQLATKLQIPIPKYIPVGTIEALQFAASQLPNSILKARSLGYDGKSQTKIGDNLQDNWKTVGERPSILEEFFNFDFEVSLIAARSKTGETVFYDLAKNTHEKGILIRSIVEPGSLEELHAKAKKYLLAILTELNYVGILAVEFFVKGDELYFNELAPRVHNTGHWTIEGAETSQFENHLRAIAGLPLGSARSRTKCEMINIIGANPDYEAVLRVENAHLHMYGKAPRPGRKLGHITVLGTTSSGLDSLVQNIL